MLLYILLGNQRRVGAISFLRYPFLMDVYETWPQQLRIVWAKIIYEYKNKKTVRSARL